MRQSAIVNALTILTNEVHRVNDRLDGIDDRLDRMERHAEHTDTSIDSIHSRLDTLIDSVANLGTQLVRHLQEGHDGS